MNSPEQSPRRTNQFWTPMRSALTLILVALLASFGVSSCNSSDHAPASGNVNAPKINVKVNNGSSAPVENNVEPVMLPASALDTSLKTIDGKPFKMAELKGKVLVIDLWATWCGPCRNEIPELVQMQTEYGSRGFEVIGLDIDPGSDSPDDVKDFIKEFKINYKVAFAERELASSLMRGGNIPQSLVVGRDGHVLVHFTGFNQVSTPKRMRAAIEEALQ